MDLFFEMHFKRFGTNSVFYTQENKAFNTEVSSQLLKNSSLKLYFMKINDDFASAMYCFEYNNKLLFYQVGYDPKWLKVSALKILIFNVIEDSINRKLVEFDFGRGTENYKFEWTDTVRETQDILIFRTKFLQRLYVAQETCYKWAKNTIKRTLRFRSQ